jgi:hypothetical protein
LGLLGSMETSLPSSATNTAPGAWWVESRGARFGVLQTIRLSMVRVMCVPPHDLLDAEVGVCGSPYAHARPGARAYARWGVRGVTPGARGAAGCSNDFNILPATGRTTRDTGRA